MQVNLCDTLKDHLREHSEPVSFDMWIQPLSFELSSNSKTMHVNAPSEFAMNMVRDRYGEKIQEKLKKVIPEKELNIKYNVEDSKTDVPLDKKSETTMRPEKDLKEKSIPRNNRSYFEIEAKSHSRLNPKFTFDSFVVGKNSQLAYAAAKAVANAPGITYNPLFIYGNTGLGKTHLMQAIGHEVKRQDKRKKIVYVTCEEFMNLMIESIQKGSMHNFKTRFRNTDVLMVDDVQFLAKKEQTQEEFFNTFNALYNNHKQIILTSDLQPKDLKLLKPRLISRFEWGLVTDIQPPTFETRVSILNKKSQLSHMQVPGDIIEFLSSKFEDNVRQMEGALNRVYLYARYSKEPLSVQLSREVLKDLIKIEKPRRITADTIQQEVCTHYGITLIQMTGPKRMKNISFPRQVAMYLSRTLTDLSLPEIGETFGGRDHTTVLHACRKIKNNMEGNHQLRQEIESISESIKSR